MENSDSNSGTDITWQTLIRFVQKHGGGWSVKKVEKNDANSSLQ